MFSSLLVICISSRTGLGTLSLEGPDRVVIELEEERKNFLEHAKEPGRKNRR